MRTRPTSTWVLGALALVLGLVLAGAVVPVAQGVSSTGRSIEPAAPEVARAAATVKLKQRSVAARAVARVRGRVAHGPRKVRVQVRAVGGRWHRAAGARSTRAGKYQAAFVAPARAGQYDVRVLAPRARIRGKHRSKVASRPVRLTVRPSGALAVRPEEKAVLSLVNAERKKAGCGPLAHESRLHLAARRHSLDMAKRGVLTHDSKDGSDYGDRVSATGYRWTMVGENVAFNQDTPAQVMAAWMASAPHRANILNCGFTELGVGLARDGAGQEFWTQDFARR